MIDQGETYRNPHYDWKALIDKAPDAETYNDLLKEKVRSIEHQAMMKERYGKKFSIISKKQVMQMTCLLMH